QSGRQRSRRARAQRARAWARRGGRQGDPKIQVQAGARSGRALGSGCDRLAVHFPAGPLIHICLLLQALASLAQTGRLATLAGEVRERGTRDRVPFVSIVATQGDKTVRAEADEKGTFSLELAPGDWQITVLGGEWERFSIRETLAAGAEVHVRYFMLRRRYGRYETVVRGKPQREEAERHSLETEEIVKIPGTNGDA